MTRTVFLLTISLQYQEEIDENKEKYELGDYLWVLNTKFLHHNHRNCSAYDKANYTFNKILRMKGLTPQLPRSDC